VTATDLGGRTPFIETYRAVYAGQLARAKAARAPLLIVASIQSVGLIVLLRGIVSGGAGPEQQQLVAGATVLVVAFVRGDRASVERMGLRPTVSGDAVPDTPVNKDLYGA